MVTISQIVVSVCQLIRLRGSVAGRLMEGQKRDSSVNIEGSVRMLASAIGT